jgi:hypothetical protein
MSEYKTEISRDEYLKALALFTLAHDHYLKSGMFGEALNRIIMNEPTKYAGGHVDDLIYSDDSGTAEQFDERLRREGIKVAEPAAEAA